MKIQTGIPFVIITVLMLVNTPISFAQQQQYVFVQEFAPNEQFSNPDITIDKQTGNIYTVTKAMIWSKGIQGVI